MARTRNLKPSFFTNETLAELPPLARLFFQGLWLYADREGRLEDRPKKLKAEILPYDDCNTDEFLNQLHQAGFLTRYEVNGKKFILLPTFKDHQNPHPKEPVSVIPPLSRPTEKVTGRGRSREKQVTVHDKPRTDHDEQPSNPAIPSYIPSPNTPTPNIPSTTLSGKPDSLAGRAREVFDYWRVVMNHPQAILGPRREGAITGRLKHGFTVERLKQAVDGCKKNPAYSEGANDRNTVYDDIELICRDEKHVEAFIAYLERQEPMDVYAEAYRKAADSGKQAAESSPIH